MSYILEALKKSQRERELGRVPTLADAPHLCAERPRRGAYWGIVALILALSALLIALYGSFGKAWLAEEDLTPDRATSGPQNPPAAQQPTVPTTPKAPEPAPKISTAHPVPQPPKPHTKRPQPATAAKPPEAPAKRQKPAPTRTQPSGVPDVPPDLVQDVRRFEEQLLQEQEMETTDMKADEPEPAEPSQDEPLESAAPTPPESTPPTESVAEAPPAPQAAREAPSRPSVLSPAVQQFISELRLTVHVYSADPKQRFVIINSRKMRQGEQAPNSLAVEEITPEGVRLQYKGQSFSYAK